ncbi:putative regulator [Tsukamurella phage TPA2]|uniref:putative regulator n=1 Tax=Tsukamurella phage TPA2 TaxID=981330 RepID=UPI0001FF8DDD|nr:putative regulator [Tsukamurella phage TPA2]ADX31984.1 putative regulator [Tsukamurella phage TPA2]
MNQTPTPDECRDLGGHHWRPQVPGQPNVCGECGYEGQVFEPVGVIPELTEQQVRIRALELANDWATARVGTGTHPGVDTITSVAKDYAAFITDGTVVS